jgi:hypothetical protein
MSHLSPKYCIRETGYGVCGFFSQIFALYCAPFLPQPLPIDARNFVADVVFKPFFPFIKVKTRFGAL